MSVIQCAECGDSSADVVAFCVECKKVLCKRCVGRLHVPESRAVRHSIERIDERHQDVQAITDFVLNFGIGIGLLLALWNFPVDQSFFRMENICPVVAQGRWWLSSFDVNVYFYFKTSISTYCDVEDSFWRLLIDGWVRGVVTGSDSILILLSTLPKALLFKVASVTLLVHILAAVYAVLAFSLILVIAWFEDMLHDLYDRVAGVVGVGNVSQWKAIRFLRFVGNLPWWIAKFALKHLQDRRSKTIENLRMIAVALGLAGSLRLVLRFIGMRCVPLFYTRYALTVNPWQLMFEPVLFFYIARLLRWVDMKLNILLPKVQVAVPEPLTLMRERPMQDIVESCRYRWARITRKFNFYRKRAEGLLRVVVDDVFNGVVVLRLAFIALPWLSGFCRSSLSIIGFAGLLERHADMFHTATGFRQGTDDMYMSDRLFTLSLGLGWRRISLVGTLRELTSMSFASLWLVALWRILVPVAMYVIYGIWQKKLAAQARSFAEKWKGQNWKNGDYQRCLQEYGTFWNNVEFDMWEPVPHVERRKRDRLFTQERRASKELRRSSKDFAESTFPHDLFSDAPKLPRPITTGQVDVQ